MNWGFLGLRWPSRTGNAGRWLVHTWIFFPPQHQALRAMTESDYRDKSVQTVTTKIFLSKHYNMHCLYN